MFISTPIAVRNRLRDDPAIQAYFATHYPGCQLHTLVGIRPSQDGETSVPMDMFPYIAVAPLAQNKEARPSRERGHTASIMYGVHDDGFADGVYLGVQAIAEIGELILQALEPQPIGTSPPVVWDGKAKEVTDAGIFHPYYEGEIIIELKVRA